LAVTIDCLQYLEKEVRCYLLMQQAFQLYQGYLHRQQLTDYSLSQDTKEFC